MFHVGSVVRVPLDKNGKRTGRATVATMDQDQVSVLLHDSAPQPLVSTTKFLITPTFESPREEEELDVSTDKIKLITSDEHELLSDESIVREKSIEESKRHYKMGKDVFWEKYQDVTVAIACFEMALWCISCDKIQIGGMSIANIKGKGLTLVDVDCMDGDSLDITLFGEEEEEEMVLSKKQVVYNVMPHQEEWMAQILSDLAKCLLELARISRIIQNRPFEYRKAAVTACNLVLSLSIDKQKEEAPLLTRARAYLELSDFGKARQDIQSVLKQHPDHVQAKELQRRIQSSSTRHAKSQKRLVKQLCAWVDKATTTSSSKVSDERMSDDSKEQQKKEKNASISAVAIQFVLPLLTCWLLWYFMSRVEHDTSQRDA